MEASSRPGRRWEEDVDDGRDPHQANDIEAFYERHAASVRALSDAMDTRSSALHAWAAAKSPQTLETYREANERYNRAVAGELRVRVELQAALENFHTAGHLALYEASVKRQEGK